MVFSKRGVAQAGSAFALGAKGRRFKSCLPDFDILVQHHKCFCDFAGTIRTGRVSIAKAVLPRFKSCLPDFDILVQHHKCFCDFAGTIRTGRVSIAKAVLPRLPPKGSLWENPVSPTLTFCFLEFFMNSII